MNESDNFSEDFEEEEEKEGIPRQLSRNLNVDFEKVMSDKKEDDFDSAPLKAKKIKEEVKNDFNG